MNPTTCTLACIAGQTCDQDARSNAVAGRHLAHRASQEKDPPGDDPDEPLDIEPSGEEGDFCTEDEDVPPDGDRDWAAEDAEIEEGWQRRLTEDPELRFWEDVRREEAPGRSDQTGT